MSLGLRDELRAKQAAWMAERRVAIDRREAEAALGPGQEPEQLLDRVTSKITERLQAEMRLQNARAMQDGAVGDQVERLLERHLEAHTCGICFELMSGKERSPTLLFPCGHTFCASCLRRLLDGSDKRSCPHCRRPITSHAPNVSLQQVIDAYVERQRSMERGVVLPEILQVSTGGAGDDGARYREQYDNLTVRSRVLQTQLRETQGQQEALRERRATAAIVLQHLVEEEEAAAARLAAARAEHELVRGQVEEQRTKLSNIDREQKTLKQQEELVASTLAPLAAEREKARLLAQGAPP